MNAKLIVAGKEFDIEILDPQLQELLEPKNKETGYEQMKGPRPYWYVNSLDQAVWEYWEEYVHNGWTRYESANYYSDKTIAENNARADKLMRQLRRFAVERREFADDSRTSFKNERWIISYNYKNNNLSVVQSKNVATFGMPWFNSSRGALSAIDRFNDELIWYFTEYKDSL